MRRVNIACDECNRTATSEGDGWEFAAVPWNATTRRVVAAHESRYGHTVRVETTP